MLRKARDAGGLSGTELPCYNFVSFSVSKVSKQSMVREDQDCGQRGIEGVAPIVSEEIAGCLPLELMPSHNDLAVPQPASTGHELGRKYS